jgi:hypothetical protein
VRLADTVAGELAQQAWLGIDAPGDPAGPAGIRMALLLGFPVPPSLEDVVEWSQPALRALLDATDRGDLVAFEGRLIGAIAAALILGAKLQETHGS